MVLIAIVASFAIILGSCRHRSQISNREETTLTDEPMEEIKGDSMIYGLSCDGSSDSVIVIWPFYGNPISYSCIEAKMQGHIIGKPQIGDWIAIMVNPEDTTEATFVINLDQLKGTWTYPVLPVMKELQNMSHRMQRRMMANMPDSVKQTYFIPREYGFTLKRSNKAQAVGRIMRSSTLEDDSPVQYPEVKNYKQWNMLNGKLILVSGERTMMPKKSHEKHKKPKNVIDTLEFIYMDDDSLILKHHGERIGFHRKENAMKANEKATKAQKIQDEKK